MKLKLFLLLFFCFSFFLFSQNDFILTKKKVAFNFKFIANVPIIKVTLNNHKDLNFILDTGSNNILIFDEKLILPSKLKNGTEIPIRGLGKESNIKAIQVLNNKVQLSDDFYMNDAEIIILQNSILDLDSKFGMKIHGIMGGDLFKNHIVQIKYFAKRLIIKKKLSKAKRYKSMPIIFNNSKPIIYINYKQDSIDIPLKMLMDTGGSDSFWIFEDDSLGLKVNGKYFQDLLGHGIGGEIIGKRTKQGVFSWNEIEFLQPTASFPEEEYIANIKFIYKDRNGSVGGEVLKRFNWIYDYKNKKVWYKKNGFFKNKFGYNLSGIEVVKPFLELNMFFIYTVVENSPAYEIGLKPDDIIVEFNGIKAEDLSLSYIISICRSKHNKKIPIKINQNGNILYKTLVLKDVLL